MDTQSQPITKSIFSPAHKAAISAGLKGKTKSEEHKKAISEGMRKKMALRKKTHTEMI